MTDNVVLTQQDVSWLEKFRQSALEFREAYDRLLSMEGSAAQNPALAAEYDDLYQQGSVIRDTIEYITRTVDSVTGFFSNAWDTASGWLRGFLNGVPPGFETMPRPRGSLGVIPLIPIAAISGAIALMGKWVSDVYLFERKLTEAQRLEGQGLSPQQAAAMAQGYADGGILADLKMPLLLGGAAYLLFVHILPAMRNK